MKSANTFTALFGAEIWKLERFHDLASMFAGGVQDNDVIPDVIPRPQVLGILNSISPKDLNETVNFAANVIGYMKRLENNLLWSNIKVRSMQPNELLILFNAFLQVADNTPSHGMLISFGPEKEALERGKDALIALRSSNQLLNTYCHRLILLCLRIIIISRIKIILCLTVGQKNFFLKSCIKKSVEFSV